MELTCYWADGEELRGRYEGVEVEIDTHAWRYDDPEHGRIGEPFVCGASEMIDVLRELDGLPKKREPFKLVFSDQPFEGAHEATHLYADAGYGDWYRWGGSMFWLCPALLDFFAEAPSHIYSKAVAL